MLTSGSLLLFFIIMPNGRPIAPWVARYVEALAGETGVSSDIIHRPFSPDGSVSLYAEATLSRDNLSHGPVPSIVIEAPESDGSVTSSDAKYQTTSGGLESYRAGPFLQVDNKRSGSSSLPSDSYLSPDPEYLGLRYPDFRKRPKLKPKVDIGAWEAPALKLADARAAPADSASWGGAGLGGATVRWAPTSGCGKKRKRTSTPGHFSSLPASRTKLDLIWPYGLKWLTTHPSGATTEGFSAPVVADRPFSAQGQARGGLAMSLPTSGSSPSQSSFAPSPTGQKDSGPVAPASFSALPGTPIRSHPPRNLPPRRNLPTRLPRRHPRPSRQAGPRGAPTAEDSASNFEEETDSNK